MTRKLFFFSDSFYTLFLLSKNWNVNSLLYISGADIDFLNSAQDGKTLKQRKEGIFYWIPSYPSSSKLPYLFTFAPQLNVTWTTLRGLKTKIMSQSGNIMLKAAWTTVSAFLVKAINSLTDSVMSQWKKKNYTLTCVNKTEFRKIGKREHPHFKIRWNKYVKIFIYLIYHQKILIFKLNFYKIHPRHSPSLNRTK